MCGRFGFIPRTYFPKRFGIQEKLPEIKPHFNITPGMQMPIIIKNSPNSVVMMRWGFIPFWAKDPKIGNRLINARAETVAEKPAFRTPFKKHRCLVLADGFYEWDKKGVKRVPYRVVLKDERPFAFAGICDYWKDEKGKELKSFSIITTDANEMIAKIHDRMPVILSKKDEKVWLDPALDITKAIKMLHPYPSEEMKMYPVSTLVNKPENDLPEVIKSAK